MKTYLLGMCILITASTTACKKNADSSSSDTAKTEPANPEPSGELKAANDTAPKSPSTEIIKVAVDGDELEVTTVGEGPAILFIHGLAVRDTLVPLALDPTFAGFKRIFYGRRGFGGKPITAPALMPQQAEDAAAILKALGIDKAHIVGHSLGGNIAMQLARTHKEMVASLILMEPMLWHESAAGRKGEADFGPVMKSYFGKGDKPAALDGLLTINAGPDHKKFIDSKLPKGAYDMALGDVDTIFKSDIGGALVAWKFAKEKGYEGLSMPVLFVSGTQSVPAMRAGGDVIAEWFPQAKRVEIADVDHFFPFRKPAEVAAQIIGFLKASAQQ